MLEQITIAAVDDHPLFLRGLKRALRNSTKLKFVAEGCSADDARRIAIEIKPEILLLDIGIPGGGLEAARSIAASAPAVEVIIITGSDDDEHVASALAAGVKGYLLKGAGADEVLSAIETVHAGQAFITQAIASRLLIDKMGPQRMRQENLSVRLTFREKQVFDYAAQGLTNKEIAAKLELQLRTVKNYMSGVLKKLQARSRLEAIVNYRRM